VPIAHEAELLVRVSLC